MEAFRPWLAAPAANSVRVIPFVPGNPGFKADAIRHPRQGALVEHLSSRRRDASVPCPSNMRPGPCTGRTIPWAVAPGDQHPTLRNRSVTEQTLALAHEWKRLGRLAT